MTVDYARRIARARELAAVDTGSLEILSFYVGLAEIQHEVFDACRSSHETNPSSLIRHFPRLIAYVERAGPEPLARFAREPLETQLLDYWQGDRSASVESQFFSRSLLQPFAEALALRGTPEPAASGACPFCGSKPVAAVMRGEGDGAKRSLICSLCSTEWIYRRILCPDCGEENKDRLPVYVPDSGCLSVQACDSCKSYLKAVDLTKDGHAVPLVDELAAVALNIWAEERGYSKLEVNLLGM